MRRKGERLSERDSVRVDHSEKERETLGERERER